MATFILVNNVQVGANQKYAGEIVDDVVEDAAAIQAAGGVLFPTGTASVDTAAASARALRARGGLAEDSSEASDLINAAIDANQTTLTTAASAAAATAQATANAAVPLATIQTADVTLVGGTATESTLNYTASSVVALIRNTGAGTEGDLSPGAITPGAPGSVVVNSASGTDTSTVTVLVIG